MNETQLVDISQYVNIGTALSQRIEHLVEQEDFGPEDLAALLQQAKTAGIHLEQDPRVQSLFSRFLADFETRKDQYSANSWRQLQYGWDKFTRWGNEQKLPTLPATAKTVEKYALAMSELMHRNSLGQLLWAIRTVHLKAGCNDPTATVAVKDSMKAVRRKKVESGEAIKQATPLRQAELDLLQKYWGGTDTVKAQRNLLALNLAYETLTRKSELARIKVGDIEVMADGSGVITIPWTKTNNSGEPEVAPITADVMNMIADYLYINDIEWGSDGHLLRPLTRYGKLQKRADTPLSSQAIDCIFSEAWDIVYPHRPALRNKTAFSGHSCRVGAAQDLLAAGYSIPGIMQSGRWKSEVMVLRYCRNIMAQEGAMFRMRQALSS
ncbi:tyrosine-type recombinase/integrase [Oceanisphaera sp. IT1-181]|uniref:tyrosine-type recombinase/integrase n=1 Tax=Oceanisphaera sp. IT1-181 TaxID=3081199 RepID=UPI0029CA979C|nr:tyrosine-type recombinase/integrase [Oceanisphaera sp. IT1-181]